MLSRYSTTGLPKIPGLKSKVSVIPILLFVLAPDEEPGRSLPKSEEKTETALTDPKGDSRDTRTPFGPIWKNMTKIIGWRYHL